MRNSFLLAIALALAAQSAFAQPQRPFGSGAPGRGAEDARGQRVDPQRDPQRRENPDRRLDPGPPEQRMSPDERRELRRQIRDHGRDNYRER